MALTRARLSQVNTEVASLQDPITLINRGATVANVDVGFVFNRDTGTHANVAVVWNESANTFAIGYTASSGADNSNVNITSHANLTVGNIFANIGGGTSTANVYITGALLPTANVAYDLGSATRRFKTLWLASNTIDLGGETISVGENGTWSFSSNGAVVSMGHSVPFNPPAISSTTGTFTTFTTTGATILANTSGNAVVASTTQSTGATSGALVVKGGIGIAKDLWVGGNLTVAGTSTTLNTATLDVTDLNITLAKNAPTAFAADGAGITIDGAGATLLYNNANDAFDFNKLVRVPGLYSTTANVTTGNIVTVNAVTLNVSTGNITTLTGTTVNVQSTTSTTLNATSANIGSTLKASGNIVAAAGTESVSATTGAIVVVGGVGASGNVTAGKLYTGSGLFWSANGVSALAAAGTTSGTSPPEAAKYGDLWYNTSNDVIYQYLTDGTSSYWIDISSQTIAANTSNVISGNLSVTYTPATVIGSAITVTGKDTQGGTGYFDFLKATNTTSGATNPNKTFRLTSTGTIEIINSAYTAALLGLSNAGDISVAGKIQVAGKTAVNGPAFAAYAAAILQTIPSGSQTKVLFQTEEFDTDNCYSSSRFTPNVEGYYQLNAEVRLDGSSGTGEMMIILYKNGSEYKRGTNQSGTQIASNFWAMQVSSLAYANGTTDYFEIYVQQGSGADRTVTAVNNAAITWFNGCMVRGA